MNEKQAKKAHKFDKEFNTYKETNYKIESDRDTSVSISVLQERLDNLRDTLEDFLKVLSEKQKQRELVKSENDARIQHQYGTVLSQGKINELSQFATDHINETRFSLERMTLATKEYRVRTGELTNQITSLRQMKSRPSKNDFNRIFLEYEKVLNALEQNRNTEVPIFATNHYLGIDGYIRLAAYIFSFPGVQNKMLIVKLLENLRMYKPKLILAENVTSELMLSISKINAPKNIAGKKVAKRLEYTKLNLVKIFQEHVKVKNLAIQHVLEGEKILHSYLNYLQFSF